MPVEVIMPKVDMDMDHGRIAAWHVAEGARVARGDPLFDIETDKAAMEVEAPGDGTLHHVTAEAGDEVAIGQPVAWIYAEGEDVGEAPAAASAPAAAAAEPAAAQPPAALVPAAELRAPESAEPRATPAARRIAAENDVALAGISGSGPRGRIQRADILAALKAMPAEARTGAPAEAPAPAARGARPGPLHVTRSGAGEKLPLVLLHGFAADSGAWTPLERALPGNREIVRIDLPAHGRSPHRVPDFPDLVADLRAAFDGLGIEVAHLVGHSLGGAAALALADTRPRSIASLTLICPAGLGAEIDGDAVAGLARAGRVESLGPWLREIVGDPDTVSSRFVQHAALARSDPAMREAQVALADRLFPDGVQAIDVAAALERLEMPTRLIWGRRDRVIPWRHALRAPGAVALHLFHDLGHMPHVEAPERIASLLRGLN